MYGFVQDDCKELLRNCFISQKVTCTIMNICRFDYLLNHLAIIQLVNSTAMVVSKDSMVEKYKCSKGNV